MNGFWRKCSVSLHGVRQFHRGTFLAMTCQRAARSSLRPVSCEVSMLGRRSHARFSIESVAEGVLSLAHDIAVRVNGDGQLVAISRDAGAMGERVRVVLADEGIHVVAEIVESKLIVRDGAVRHRLLMRPLDGDGDVHYSERTR